MADPLGALPVGPYGPGPSEQSTPAFIGQSDATPSGGSFVDLLKRSVNEVNNMQDAAGNKVQKLVTGEISSIHEVMIATEEAGIALNLLMQIRNQLLRAWNELKRTPV